MQFGFVKADERANGAWRINGGLLGSAHERSMATSPAIHFFLITAIKKKPLIGNSREKQSREKGMIPSKWLTIQTSFLVH